MGLSPGAMLFYIGITGMPAVIIAAVVITIRLSGGRKRLRRQFEEEYGK